VQVLQSLYQLADFETATVMHLACKGAARDALDHLELEGMLEQAD